MSAPPRIVQTLLYAPAPFFGNPIKPLLNMMFGAGALCFNAKNVPGAQRLTYG